MSCQLSTSSLPGIWVIETLALSNQVDVSLLLDLLEKFPQTSDDLGRNARELVSFRILESFLFRGAQSNSVSSSSSRKIAFDPSESCEDVLQRILLETPALNLKAAGPEMWKWDVQSFIALKRSSLDKHTLLQLKDAILTGSHSFLASFKEQSGLPFGNQPEHELLVDDDKCSGIVDRFEGIDHNTCIGEGKHQFISPALANSSYVLHSDLPNEDLLSIKRTRSATTENVGEKSCTDQIISENGYENHIIPCEQDFGGNLTLSGVNKQFADKTLMIAQYKEGERCSLVRNIHVQEIELNRPPEDDNSECISLKDDEILPCEKQASHCNTELPNDKSDEEHGQENKIKETKSENEGSHYLRSTDYMNVQNGDEKEIIHISSNSQCTHNRYSSETNCRDLYLLAEICGSIVELGDVLGYSLKSRTCLEGMGQNGPPGDVNNEFISKGLMGCGNVMHHEKQVYHLGTKRPNKNFDEEQGQDCDADNAGDKDGLHELKTTGGHKNRFEQEFHRNIPDLNDAEDVDISGDSDEYRDERTDIATKKNAFMSSQCTFSQGSVATLDCREQNVCLKCSKGGKLLFCSTKSCPLVIHESCCGSHASFGTTGQFYCPFCAYSQAISKYMDTKKNVSLTRTNLADFVCLGTRKELKKQPGRSYRTNQNHLEHGDALHKTNEASNQDVAECTDNHQCKRKLEQGQAGCSTLSSDDNLPLEGKTVDSTDGRPPPLNKDKKVRKDRVTLKPQSEIVSCQVPEKGNGSESHAEIRSKKGVLHSPGTNLPHEYKCSLHTESADAEEISEEENEISGVSKYFTRVKKHKKQYAYPEAPQLRRRRLLWTTEEEEKLKEGLRRFCSPHDRYIPWKKILEFGAGVFQGTRSTMDLKDKWRNLCKASPKS